MFQTVISGVQHITLKGVIEAVNKVGLPTALTLWLVYLLSTGLVNNVRAVVESTAQTQQLLQSHVDGMLPMSHMQQQIVNIQLQQCANAATDNVERSACFQSLYRQPEQ